MRYGLAAASGLWLTCVRCPAPWWTAALVAGWCPRECRTRCLTAALALTAVRWEPCRAWLRAALRGCSFCPLSAAAPCAREGWRDRWSLLVFLALACLAVWPDAAEADRADPRAAAAGAPPWPDSPTFLAWLPPAMPLTETA